MDTTISPALRKATQLLNLTKYGQFELMRFNETTLEHALHDFNMNVNNPYVSFKDKCWKYHKQNNFKVNRQYFDFKDQIPANARFTISDKLPSVPKQDVARVNVIQDKIPKPKTPTAMELANRIHIMKINKDQSIDNMATLYSKEECEAYYFKVLIDEVNARYVTTGEPQEEFAIQYINEHRAKYPLVIEEEKKQEQIVRPEYKTGSFLEEFGMKPEVIEVKPVEVKEPTPIQDSLMEMFPSSYIDLDEYEEII